MNNLKLQEALKEEIKSLKLQIEFKVNTPAEKKLKDELLKVNSRLNRITQMINQPTQE